MVRISDPPNFNGICIDEDKVISIKSTPLSDWKRLVEDLDGDFEKELEDALKFTDDLFENLSAISQKMNKSIPIGCFYQEEDKDYSVDTVVKKEQTIYGDFQYTIKNEEFKEEIRENFIDNFEELKIKKLENEILFNKNVEKEIIKKNNFICPLHKIFKLNYQLEKSKSKFLNNQNYPIPKNLLKEKSKRKFTNFIKKVKYKKLKNIKFKSSKKYLNSEKFRNIVEKSSIPLEIINKLENNNKNLINSSINTNNLINNINSNINTNTNLDNKNTNNKNLEDLKDEEESISEIEKKNEEIMRSYFNF